MDLALFFVLPLIGGFAFVTQLALLRYQTGREDSQRLYYRAALYGVVLAVAAAVLHELMRHGSARYADFIKGVASDVLQPLLERDRSTSSVPLSAQAQAIRVELAIVCVYAFLLGALTPVWNFVLLACDRAWVAVPSWSAGRSFLDRLNLRSITDQFEKLLAQSLFSASLIQVTLSNSKVYVGSVLESPDPRSPAKYFKLQPWMSGHRGEDGTVAFNTFYDDVLSAFRIDPDMRAVVESFQLVVPIEKVVTASGFDVRAYERFLEGRAEEEGEDEPPTPEGEGGVLLAAAKIGALAAAWQAIAAVLRLFR